MRDESRQRSPQQKICGYEYTVKRGDSFYLIAQRLGVPLRDLLEANNEVNPARLMVGDVLCIPMEEDDAVTQPAQEQAVTEPTAPAADAHEQEASQPATPVPQLIKPAPAPETPASSVQQEEAGGAEMQAESMITVTEVVLGAMPDVPADECVTPPAEAAGDTTACKDGVQYVVEAGDTAAGIQQAADISLKTLAAANPGVDLESLQAGETLCVPTVNQPCPNPRFYRVEEGGNLEAVALLLDVSVSALLRANPCLKPSDFKAGAVISLP